jgi:hypothetical protein
MDVAKTGRLASTNYQLVHKNSPDARGIDCALLVDASRFKVLTSEFLTVSIDTIPNFKTRDILYVKGLLAGNKTVHVFVHHWPSRRGGEEASAPGRALAASIAKHKIDSVTAIDPKAKIVLMGDLNDDPISPSITSVIGARGEKEEVRSGGMYNPWMDPYKKGIGTLAYQDAWGLFDQILISYGWLDKNQKGYHYYKAEIFNREFMVQKTGKYKGYPMRTYDGNRYNGGYSDHFPTYIILAKPVE